VRREVGELAETHGHHERQCLGRQVLDGAVASGFGDVQPQLVVQVVEANWLEIVDAADRDPAGDAPIVHLGGGEVPAG